MKSKDNPDLPAKPNAGEKVAKELDLPEKGKYHASHPMSLETYEAFYQEICDRAYTQGAEANSFIAKDPQRAAHCLWLVSQGVPKAEVQRRLGISATTLRNLCFDHKRTIDEQRKRMSGVYLQAANEYIELLFKKAELLEQDEDKLSEISPDKLAITVGIMTDHHSKLAGLNSITIEHKKGATIEDAQAYLENLRKNLANKLKRGSVDAEVIDDSEPQ